MSFDFSSIQSSIFSAKLMEYRKNLNFNDRVLYDLTEKLWNAYSFKAKNVKLWCLKFENKYYSVFAHDGKPFNSIEEMAKSLQIAQSPNEEGKGFHGGGLKIGSKLLVGDPLDYELIIYSETINEGRKSVSSNIYKNSSNRKIEIKDSTNKWVPAILEMFDNKMEGINVVYISRYDPDPLSKAKKPALYNEKTISNVQNMIPLEVLDTIDARYSIKEVISLDRVDLEKYSKYCKGEDKLLHSDIFFPNVTTASVYSSNDGGRYINQKILNYKEYKEAFMEKSFTFVENINFSYEEKHYDLDVEVDFNYFHGLHSNDNIVANEEYIKKFSKKTIGAPLREYHAIKRMLTISFPCMKTNEFERHGKQPLYYESKLDFFRYLDLYEVSNEINFKLKKGDFPQYDSLLEAVKNNKYDLSRKPYFCVDIKVKKVNQIKSEYITDISEGSIYETLAMTNEIFISERKHLLKHMIRCLAAKIKNSEKFPEFREFVKKAFPDGNDGDFVKLPNPYKLATNKKVFFHDPNTKDTLVSVKPGSHTLVVAKDENGNVWPEDLVANEDGVFLEKMGEFYKLTIIELSEKTSSEEFKPISEKDWIDLPAQNRFPRRTIYVRCPGGDYYYEANTRVVNPQVTEIKNPGVKTKKDTLEDKDTHTDEMFRLLTDSPKAKIDWHNNKIILNKSNDEIKKIFKNSTKYKVFQIELWDKINEILPIKAVEIYNINYKNAEEKLANQIENGYGDSYARFILNSHLDVLLSEKSIFKTIESIKNEPNLENS